MTSGLEGRPPLVRGLRRLRGDARRMLARLTPKARARARALRANDIAMIEASGLFLPEHYLSQSPALAGQTPAAHYYDVGSTQGLNPNPLFDTAFYLAQNPDVAEDDLNPLLHFIQHGAQEGRAPSPRFDCRFYLATNPDVAAAGINPLLHYLLHGAREGRTARPDGWPLTEEMAAGRDSSLPWREALAWDVAAARQRLATLLRAIAVQRGTARIFRADDAAHRLDITRNLDRLSAAGLKVGVTIFGRHSDEWTDALGPTAPVWSLLPEVTRVSTALETPAASLEADAEAGLAPVVLPLLEPHIRALEPDSPAFRPPREALELLSNKLLFGLYAQDHAPQDVPRLFTSPEEAAFPCIVKCTHLNGGKGAIVVRSDEELARAMDDPSWRGMPKVITAFVPGEREGVTHAVCGAGRILWHTTYEYRMPPGEEVRGPRNHAAIRRHATPRKVLRFLQMLVDELGFEGPINMDYRLAAGRLQVFEVNPRLGGSLMWPEHMADLAEALRATLNGALVRPLARRIARSPFFCAEFYGQTVPALAGDADALARHHLLRGGLEGLDPGPAFSSHDYLALNAAHCPPGTHPLLNHMLAGEAPGLPVVDYDRRRPTLAAHILAPLPIGARHDRVRTVTAQEAMRLIADERLCAAGGVHHYSWDLERFHDRMYVLEDPDRLVVFGTRNTQYRSSPLPLFTSSPAPARVLGPRNRHWPFWYLQLEDFDAFLARRSRTSSRPSAHFPTRETWNLDDIEKRYGFERWPLAGHEERFTAAFTRMKDPNRRFDGAQCLGYYCGIERRAPLDWFVVYALRERATGQEAGVLLSIEDGTSATLLNLASLNGHVKLLMALCVQSFCARGLAACDGGISGYYGTYKSTFFLDTLEVEASGFLPR